MLRYLAAVLLVVLIASGCSAQTVRLAANGQATATIVRSSADQSVVAAAQVLQECVRKLVGVELPIVDDGAPVTGAAVLVGQCQASLPADLPPADAGPEAYAIRVRDGHLILTGRKPWCVEFAVYSFLEDDLGVRWFVPGPLGEYIPPHAQGELTVQVTPRVVAPDFSPRIWSGNSIVPEWATWNRRNKISLSSDLPWRQFQNNIYRVFPPSKYAAEHPEYYPLINGQRWIPPDDNAANWRPCESNPDVIRLTVEYARRWLDEHPEANGFSVGMDDISHLCQCPDCIALDPDPEAYKRRDYSDRHYWFVNTIARELARTHPDKYIGTLIYSIARKPPTRIDVLEPNVFGYITQCEAEWWREGLRAQDEALTREWRRRCQHLCRYTYWGLGWTTPRYFPHWLAEAIKLDHELGFHGQYVEVYTNWPNTGPMVWAASKLLWDADLDLNALLDEFMTKMFAEAAPEMAAYYQHLERTWMAGHPGRTGWGHRNLSVQVYSMTLDQLAQAERLLAAAAAKATDPVVRQRIAMVERGLRTGAYVIRSGQASDRLNAAPITNAAQAEAVLNDVVATINMIRERDAYYAELRAGNDLAAQTLKLLDWYFRDRVPLASLDGGLPSAMARALGWLQVNAPDRVPEVAARLRQAAPPEVLSLLDAWTYVAQGKAPNLLKNPSFEEAGENQAQPEMDWSTAGAPPGWSTWSRYPLPGQLRATTEAAEGARAASITQAESACYLQNVPVQPGERYLCSLRARRLPPDGRGQVSLSVRWRARGGGWLEDRSAERTVNLPEFTSDWQSLYLLVDVPDNAGALVFMAIASNLGEAVTALFDDAGVYRVPAQQQ